MNQLLENQTCIPMKQCFYILILFVITFQCKPKTNKEESISTVVFFRTQGVITFTNAEGKTFAPKLLDLLHDGDHIKTAAKSQAEFLLATGGIIRLLEGSELILDTKLLSEQNVVKSTLRLSVGRVFVKQPKPLKKGETIQVVTPTQIAGVRGTEFLTEVTSNSSQVLVSEGTVQTDWKKDESPNELSESGDYVAEGNKSQADDLGRETKPLTEEDKQLLAEQSKSAADLLEEAKVQMESIREQFEKEREQIKQHLQDFKTQNKVNLDEQKAKNQDLLETQKATNKELMDGAKGETVKESKSMQNNSANQKSDIKNNAKSELDALKESMKK